MAYFRVKQSISERSSTIKLRYHTIASLGGSVIFYLIFNSFFCALICFLAGILVDLDHFFDYVKYTGWNTNLKQFFHYSYGAKFKQFYLLFHSYEYLPLIAIIIIISDYNLLLIAAAIGFTQHLIFDQFTNPVKPLAYFLTYRSKNKFSKESFLKDDFLSSLSDD